MNLVGRARAALRTALASIGPDVTGRPLGAEGFRLTRSLPHDATAFTQGLAWADGELYESTGLHGASTLRRVALDSGRVLRRAALPRRSFGEGLAVVADRIVQLTWREGTGIVYDRRTLSPVTTFPYRGQGWGLCFDGARLLMSDGTGRIRFLDPATYAECGALDVRCDGRPVERLNDLTVVEDEIIANVHGLDRLVRVRADGTVVGWIDVAPLRRTWGLRGHAQVANGVTWDAARGRLLVTGKLWPRLFEIAPPERRTRSEDRRATVA